MSSTWAAMSDDLRLSTSKEATPCGDLSPSNPQATIADGVKPGLLPETPGISRQVQIAAGPASALPACYRPPLAAA